MGAWWLQGDGLARSHCAGLLLLLLLLRFRMRARELSAASSLCRCLQWPRQVQAQVRIWKFHTGLPHGARIQILSLDLPHGWQGPIHLSHYIPSNSVILEWGSFKNEVTGHGTKNFDMGYSLSNSSLTYSATTLAPQYKKKKRKSYFCIIKKDIF